MTNEVLLHEIGLLRNILRVQYVSELIHLIKRVFFRTSHHDL